MSSSPSSSIPPLAKSYSLSSGSVPTILATITLDSIFQNAGQSPPMDSTEVHLNPIITKANAILDLTEREGWARLNNHEKVQFAFLIWKNQHTLLLQDLENNPASVAKRMIEVFDPKSDAYKKLEPFLQAGGDKGGMREFDYFSKFLAEFPFWRDSPSAVSIFTQMNDYNQQMLPFVRFQAIISMVCFVVSAANAILYYMMMTTGTPRELAISQYGINIGRFMRNNLSDTQVFEIVFRNNGGYPEDILESLLAHSTNLQGRKKTKTAPFDLETCYLSEDPSVCVYSMVSSHLQRLGPLLVCDFRMFSRYSNTEIKTFSGDWDQWKDEDSTNGCQYHAFLITGVDYTDADGMGGIVFQVQDSLPGRPFVNIGLELIRSMGVSDVVGIKKDVVFQGTTPRSQFDSVPFEITSGSPSPSPRSVPTEIATDTNAGTEIGRLSRLSSIDQGDSAVGDTESTVGSDIHSQKGTWTNPWPLNIEPGTDTTKLVITT